MGKLEEGSHSSPERQPVLVWRPRDGSIKKGTYRQRNVPGGVGIGVDVTEQEGLTRALHESEQQLRQVVDLAPQIVGVLGPNRERLYANRLALQYYGVNLDEWRRRSSAVEVHPDDYDPIKAVGDRSPSHSDAFESEMRLRKGTERIAGFSFGTTRFVMIRDSSCGGTSHIPISRIARQPRSDCARKTSRFERKSTKPRCSKKLSALRRR